VDRRPAKGVNNFREPGSTPVGLAHRCRRLPEVEGCVLVDETAVDAALADGIHLEGQPLTVVGRPRVRTHDLMISMS